MSFSEVTFRLVPRRRLIGLSFGTMHSARRGMGSDVAGSRPYRVGDDIDTIDWNASARLSSARASDEFIVREHYADEAPRVVILCDLRPEMTLYPAGLPWLSKPAAMRHAVELICESAFRSHGFVGYLDYATGEPFWQPLQSGRELRRLEDRHVEWPAFDAPPSTLELGLAYLVENRLALPAGSFLFLLSDFLTSPPGEAWQRVLERNWDVVPVVIQDPTWEQSFPEASGINIPLVDPRSGHVTEVRLSKREVLERRLRNEQRLGELHDGFRDLGVDPMLISSSDRDTVLSVFLTWAEQRLHGHGREW
jgi:uncharacterized protein (DUF58 family)